VDPGPAPGRRERSGTKKSLTGLPALLLAIASLATSACRPKEKATDSTPTAERSGVTALQTTDVCSPAQEKKWTAVRDDTLGASAFDPMGHTIGKRPARKFVFLNNWYPLDVVKQTVCGDLFRYDFYDGLGKEADWNNFVVPSASFTRLLNDARAYAKQGAVRDCGAPHNCFEAEITPQQNFLENTYFPPRRGASSPRVGQPICLYGPWVAEKLHGDRPEIHPSEVVWWREPIDGEPHHFFLLVQDDSNRFDREGDFGGASVPGWLPWSQFPRSAALRVAFEWKVSDPARTLNIHFQGQHVVTGSAGRDHTLQYQGKPVIRLIERQADEKDVGVDFVDVCRDASATLLRGYVQISAKFGKGDRDDKEGFAVLRVGPGDSVLPQLRTAGPRVTARSPRRAEATDRPRLLVDLELEFPPDARRAPDDSVVRDATLPSGRRLPVPTPMPGRRAVIEGVPVEPGVVTVGLQSGRQVPIALPALGVAPLVTRETPELGAADPSAWESLMGSAGARAPAARARLPQNLTLQASPKWTVSSQIEYAPRRDGEVAAEDGSSLSEELNSIVRRGAARELSGSQKLFSTRWTFSATDLTTERPVPVIVNDAAGATQVRVDVSTGDVAEEGIRVTFPAAPASHLYRLVARAKTTDVFGHTGDLEEEVWSHVLTAENPSKLADALVIAAGEMAGADSERLGAISRLDLSRKVSGDETEPQEQRARLLRLAAERAAEDNVATVGELEQLVRVAALLGRKQP